MKYPEDIEISVSAQDGYFTYRIPVLIGPRCDLPYSRRGEAGGSGDVRRGLGCDGLNVALLPGTWKLYTYRIS